MIGGVLIIGSLFWDKDQGKYINLRADWRKKRLLYDKRIHLFAPIRYGRVSDDGVYTMVFSKEAADQNNFGTAYFLPFKKEIKTFSGLNKEAEQLSNAEGGKDVNLVKGNDDKWCIIGILFNPKFDLKQREKLLKRFEKKLNAQGLGNEHSTFCVPPESSILTNRGEINISWPKTTNPNDQTSLDGFDLILATCPKQNVESYPDHLAIKAGALKNERKYFFNNIRKGITTFQDLDILHSILTEEKNLVGGNQ